MPFRYFEELSTADAAFEVWADSLEQLFVDATGALTNLMVEELDTLAPVEKRTISLQDSSLEMLLFGVLQELIYLKDAQLLLLRFESAEITKNGEYHFTGEGYGEELDPKKHHLAADVKAVTLHNFKLEKIESGWKAIIVVDI